MRKRLQNALELSCHIAKISIHLISAGGFFSLFAEVTQSPAKAFVGAFSFFLINITFDRSGHRLDSRLRVSSSTFLTVVKVVISILEAILISEHANGSSLVAGTTLTEAVVFRLKHDWLFIPFVAALIYMLDYMSILLPAGSPTELSFGEHDLAPGRPKPIHICADGPLPKCCLLIRYSIPKGLTRGVEFTLSNHNGTRIELGIVRRSGRKSVNIPPAQWILTAEVKRDNPKGGFIHVQVLQYLDDKD
jgi:hypothetical protein